jgi:8-oxo-dGTP pyrophosphatase MutT (NUDIX family)
MVQSAASEIAKIITVGETVKTLHRITLQLLDGSRICQQIHLSNLCDKEEAGVRQLFASLNSQYADLELVDMVNNAGLVLGALPRPYIHTWNILHRGSGILVSKDKDAFQAAKEGAAMPEVYVHQRTSRKRIFPSLYDMFVGGVSCHGEDSRLTAAREVAEELGLRRALDIMLDSKQQPQDLEEEENDKLDNPLSETLFQCTVCTSYNRCVVSVFTYTACDGERITWQDEEVAWGDYVPYAVVEQSAASSIDRLVKSGVWPDKEHRIINGTKRSIGDKQLTVNTEVASKYSADTWDYVPDGLLVWNAWNSFLSGITANPSSSSSL